MIGGLAPVSTPLSDVFMFTIEGGDLSLEERRSLLDWTIRPALRTIPGVADVNALGGMVRTFEVIPDSAALASAGLGVSDLLAKVDERPVWSIACLFVAKRYRNQGLSLALVKAAVDYAGQRGAQIVEGYPIRPREGHIKVPAAVTWTGLESVFVAAGFVEAARRVEMRPIMRFYISRNEDR